MKKMTSAVIAYFTTGIGFYYTFFNDANFYSLTILTIGLLGVLFDFYNKKVYKE